MTTRPLEPTGTAKRPQVEHVPRAQRRRELDRCHDFEQEGEVVADAILLARELPEVDPASLTRLEARLLGLRRRIEELRAADGREAS